MDNKVFKIIKLTSVKNGKGYLTNFKVTIGTKEARECGFLDSEGNPLPIKKTVDLDSKKIIFELASEDDIKSLE